MSIIKVTVNLPEEQVIFLKKIARSENITFTDVLRRSINSEKFFIEQEIANRKILVEDSDGQLREVLRK